MENRAIYLSALLFWFVCPIAASYIAAGKTCIRYEKHSCATRVNQTASIPTGSPPPVLLPGLPLVQNRSLCISTKGRFVANWPIYCDEMLDIGSKKDASVCDPSCMPTKFVTEGPGDGQTDPIAAGLMRRIPFFPPECGKGCRTKGVTELLRRLRGKFIIIVGDSVMRQLAQSLPQLLRADKIALDISPWCHVRYQLSFSDYTDSLSFVASNIAASRGITRETCLDRQAVLQSIERMLSDAWHSHNQDTFTLVSFYFPTFSCQSIFFTHLASHLSLLDHKSGPNPFVLFSVGFWEIGYLKDLLDLKGLKENEREWVDAVETIHNSGRATFIYLPMPTTRIVFRKSEADAVESRAFNKIMDRWMEEELRGAHILPFDILASLENAPPGVEGHDWHYMCGLSFIQEFQAPGSDILEEVTWTRIRILEDGTCFDDMNRSLWLMALQWPIFAAGEGVGTGTGTGGIDERRYA